VDYLANIVQAQVGPVQSLWETQGTTGTSIAKGGCSTTSEFRGMGMSVAFFLSLQLEIHFKRAKEQGRRRVMFPLAIGEASSGGPTFSHMCIWFNEESTLVPEIMMYA
jgi:hypothetical protein